MIKKCLLSLIFTVVFFSCKKNEINKELSYPYDLTLTDIKVTTKIILFSGQKEIRDQFIIDRFVADAEIFSQIKNVPFVDKNITVLSQDSLYFKGPTKNSHFNIEKVGDDILMVSSPKLRFYMDDVNRVFLVMAGELSLFPERILGTRLPLTVNNIRIGRGNLENMEVSAFAAKWILHDGNTKPNVTQFWGSYINRPNYEFVKKLRTTDTLALQEVVYSFQKR